jgi:hypothetical protein
MILFFVLLCCLAIPLIAGAAFRVVRTGRARITPLSRTTGANGTIKAGGTTTTIAVVVGR